MLYSGGINEKNGDRSLTKVHEDLHFQLKLRQIKFQPRMCLWWGRYEP